MIWFIVGAILGYAASVFTWPLFRQFLLGSEAEVIMLRDKAKQIETNLRAKL